MHLYELELTRRKLRLYKTHNQASLTRWLFLRQAIMDYCVQCKWFKDGQLHHTYISPRCTVRGDDDAAYMRAHVCGIDEATLYEPRCQACTDHDGRKLEQAT